MSRPVHWFPTVLTTLVAAVFTTTQLACRAPVRPTLRVATWNIAHGRGLANAQLALPPDAFAPNLDRIADVLRREQPDIVALQEADAPSFWSGNFDHVQYLSAAADHPHTGVGHHVNLEVAGRQLRYGTALLAHQPLRATQSLAFRQNPFDTKGAVWAEIDFAGRPVVVASVHLHHNDPDQRARQAEALANHLGALDRSLIVMGDLNCPPDEPAWRTLTTRLKLSAHRPADRDRATFPALEPTIRIDWILVSQDLEIHNDATLPDACSDHRCVLATLAWRADR